MNNDEVLDTAAGMAELLDFCLSLLQRDAQKLADSATEHSASLPISIEYITAINLSAQAAELAKKINLLIHDLSPQIGDVVAEARLAQFKRSGGHLH